MTTFNYPFLTADEIKKKRNIAFSINFLCIAIFIVITFWYLFAMISGNLISLQISLLCLGVSCFSIFYSLKKLNVFCPIYKPHCIEKLNFLRQEFSEVEQYYQRVIHAEREFTEGEFNYIVQWSNKKN